MTVKELAEKCGCSKAWVYAVIKKTGKMPTYEEMQARKGKSGRPTKYRGK